MDNASCNLTIMIIFIRDSRKKAKHFWTSWLISVADLCFLVNGPSHCCNATIQRSPLKMLVQRQLFGMQKNGPVENAVYPLNHKRYIEDNFTNEYAKRARRQNSLRYTKSLN